MKNICIVFLLLILASCNGFKEEKVDVLVDEFPNNILLHPSKLHIPSILFKPVRMCTVDSFLIVLQDRGDFMLNIFSLPECQHVCNFGRRGNGPDEFLLSFSGTFKPLYGEHSGFTMGNKMIGIRYYRMRDVLNGNTTPYKSLSLPPKLNSFRATINISDSLIFGSPYGGYMEIFKFNNDTHNLECFKEYPNGLPLMNDEAKTNLYAYYLASKPDNKKFARVYESQGKLEIFNLVTKNHLLISYKDFPTLMDNYKLNNSLKELPFDENQLIFCWGIQATDKYIYARIYNDKYKNIVKNGGVSRDFIPEIHVFDWLGNPIAKCRLSDYYDYFTIDKNDQFIFTCDSYYPDVINRYKLGQLIKN